MLPSGVFPGSNKKQQAGMSLLNAGYRHTDILIRNKSAVFGKVRLKDRGGEKVCTI